MDTSASNCGMPNGRLMFNVAFVVVLENAGSGGHTAGPVAREFVQAMLALGLIERRLPSAPSAN